MLKNTLSQSLHQKLSPSQIQLMNMLSLPVLAFEQYVSAELEANPALEAAPPQDDEDDLSVMGQEEEYEPSSSDITIEDDLSAYMYDDDVDDMPAVSDGEGRNAFMASHSVGDTFSEYLLGQLALEDLTERQMTIGRYIIGNIDSDGYLRRDLMSISDDMAFSQGMDVKEDEIREVLTVIQGFDPSGVGASTLQECLLLQLKSKTPTSCTALAEKIVSKHFDSLTKKNYDKILRGESCTRAELSAAMEEISALNPRPGGGGEGDITGSNMGITPDFIISIDGDSISVSMYQSGVPSLHVSDDYTRMLADASSQTNPSRSQNETLLFVKSKVDAARWFIDAIRQRKNTMMNIMRAIVRRQQAFILSGDVADLCPMGMKDIAADVNMDISTVSRVVSQKYAYTPYGTMELKSFFSEGRTTSSGEDVSVKEVKQALEALVNAENKENPLTDDVLTELLEKEGYKIARRTVAKYREAMGIPVARMRKKV